MSLQSGPSHSKRCEEDFGSSEKMHKTFNIFRFSSTYQSNFQISESSKASRYYQMQHFKAFLALKHFYFNYLLPW